jgi:hypothetical protein
MAGAGAGPPPLRLPLRRVVSAVPCGGPAGRAVVMAAFSDVGVWVRVRLCRADRMAELASQSGPALFEMVVCAPQRCSRSTARLAARGSRTVLAPTPQLPVVPHRIKGLISNCVLCTLYRAFPRLPSRGWMSDTFVSAGHLVKTATDSLNRDMHRKRRMSQS